MKKITATIQANLAFWLFIFNIIDICLGDYM